MSELYALGTLGVLAALTSARGSRATETPSSPAPLPFPGKGFVRRLGFSVPLEYVMPRRQILLQRAFTLDEWIFVRLNRVYTPYVRTTDVGVGSTLAWGSIAVWTRVSLSADQARTVAQNFLTHQTWPVPEELDHRIGYFEVFSRLGGEEEVG